MKNIPTSQQPREISREGKLSNKVLQELVIQSQKTFDALRTAPQVLSDEEVMLEIQTKIESLPPLPASIFEIEKLRTSDTASNEDLLKIIEKDPMVTANVLRVANSAMFGFASQIKNPKIALNMLGFNMVCSIAISTAIRKTIPADFAAYALTPETFSNISATQSALILKWKDRKLLKHKNNLALAALLQEIGKMIISSTLKGKGKQVDFKMQVLIEDDPSIVEKRYIGMAASYVTSMIFKYWRLNPPLVELILKSEKPNEIEDETLRNQAYALKISRTLFPAVAGKGITETNRNKAFELCEEGGLDSLGLENVLELMREEEEENNQQKK